MDVRVNSAYFDAFGAQSVKTWFGQSPLLFQDVDGGDRGTSVANIG